jgi:hypothetical protein
MTVERTRTLSGRDDIVGVAEVFCAKEWPDACGVALELVPFREMFEL